MEIITVIIWTQHSGMVGSEHRTGYTFKMSLTTNETFGDLIDALGHEQIELTW